MGDLDRLIAAVEAGRELSPFDFSDGFGRSATAQQCNHGWGAYNGDLNAALRLHEALLPGWKWSRHHDGEIEVWTHGVLNSQWGRSAHSIPARALLLAILRAVSATKGDQP